jgi:hypothetical protein
MGYDSIKINVDAKRLRPLDVDILCCDASKARKLTGWETKVDIKEGLKRTVEWFKEHGESWIWEQKIITEEEMWKNEEKDLSPKTSGALVRQGEPLPLQKASQSDKKPFHNYVTRLQEGKQN